MPTDKYQESKVFKDEMQVMLEAARPLVGQTVDGANLYDIIKSAVEYRPEHASDIRKKLWKMFKQNPKSEELRLAMDITATIDTLKSNCDNMQSGTAAFTLKTLSERPLDYIKKLAASQLEAEQNAR